MFKSIPLRGIWVDVNPMPRHPPLTMQDGIVVEHSGLVLSSMTTAPLTTLPIKDVVDIVGLSTTVSRTISLGTGLSADLPNNQRDTRFGTPRR